jgi:hypothetical protein
VFATLIRLVELMPLPVKASVEGQTSCIICGDPDVVLRSKHFSRKSETYPIDCFLRQKNGKDGCKEPSTTKLQLIPNKTNPMSTVVRSEKSVATVAYTFVLLL